MTAIDEWLDVRGIAGKLGLGRTQVYEVLGSGRLKAVKGSRGEWLARRSDVEAYRRDQQPKAPSYSEAIVEFDALEAERVQAVKVLNDITDRRRSALLRWNEAGVTIPALCDMVNLSSTSVSNLLTQERKHQRGKGGR